MHRTDGEGNVAGMFQSGDPMTGTKATRLTPAWLNDVQENIAQFIEAMGVALVKGTYTQLRDAIFAAAANPNTLINGNLDVWQRGTNFAAAADGTYTADRWRYGKTGAQVVTLSQQADVPTVAQSNLRSSFSLKALVTTANAAPGAGDFSVIGQRVEGINWSKIAQRANMISFWVKSNVTGTYCVSLRNSGTDRSYVGEFTIAAADTWEKKKVSLAAAPSTGTWDFAQGIGVDVCFCLAAGATFQTAAGAWANGNFVASANQVNALAAVNNYFQFSQVKLEAGSVASNWLARQFNEELQLCKRYFWKSFVQATVPAQNAGTTNAVRFGQIAGAVTASTYGQFNFAVEMRAAPTMTGYNPSANNGQVRNTVQAADCSALALTANTYGFSLNSTSTSGSSQGNAQILHITADAEL